ncbi:MAG: tRNA pseudouridine(13) synthase TruD [Thaumarchaeota archaeon]|nr:tRNA pseudouridine(13) synthase TruD [Nitrososphaerota archaeon]
MTPSLDREIGMGAHATSFAGCGGSIKRDASDFAVSEVLGEEAMEMSRGGDGYAVFVMKKSGIDTPHALQAVRRATGMRLKALGLKDARAVTEQYVCATSRSTRLEAYSGRGVSLVPVGRAPRPLRGGDMVGNSFAIVVRGHDGTLGDFAEWDGVPNYYAYQRFGGARPVTHAIGRAIVAGDWARAVAEVLGRAGEGMTHAEMARGLPRGMDIERGVASAMASGAGELAALRTVPVGTRRLYVQAYQSYIFNRTLAAAIDAGEPLAARDGDVCYGAGGRLCRHGAGGGAALAIPLMGHSYYARTRFAGLVAEVMREEGASPRDFAVRGMQEAAAEGGFRTAMALPREASVGGDCVRVTLRRGSYATALMREVIKPPDPAAAGLAG